MDLSKLERELFILQQCNSVADALNRALDPAGAARPNENGADRKTQRLPIAAPPPARAVKLH